MIAMRRLAAAAVATAAAATLVAGCGSSPITATKLSGSLASTFARLYVLQQTEAGNPRPVRSDLRTRAHCVKGTPRQVQRGSGNDWLCYVRYSAAGPGTRVIASYLVTVQPDGCYAADGDGPQTLNGRPTITGRGYRQLTNPLYLVNGCFDVG